MLLVWCLRKIAILNFGNIWMSFYADEDHSSDERKRENDDQEQNHTSTCLNRIIDDDSLPGRVFLDFTFSDSSFSVSSGSSMGCSRWSWCFECWLWRFIYRIMVLNIYKAKTRTMNGFLRDEFSSHKWSPPSRSSVASFICKARYSITGMKMQCGTAENKFKTEKIQSNDDSRFIFDPLFQTASISSSLAKCRTRGHPSHPCSLLIRLSRL